MRERRSDTRLTLGDLRSLLLPLGPLVGEELLQHQLAVRFHHSPENLAAVVEAVVIRDRVERVASAPLGISRPVDHRWEAGLDDCTRTHGAGFQRDIQRAVEQSPRVSRSCRLSNRQHLGVCRRVFEGFSLVVSFSDDSSFVDDQSPDRHFFLIIGHHRQFDCSSHKGLVDRVRAKGLLEIGQRCIVIGMV